MDSGKILTIESANSMEDISVRGNTAYFLFLDNILCKEVWDIHLHFHMKEKL